MNDNMPETLASISHETRSQWLAQRVAILRNNPNFVSTAGDYARGIVGIFEGEYIANKVMANIARQIISRAILALHFARSEGRGGAIISTLQNITTVLGLCSNSTTAATVNLLENTGLVTRVQDERDHRTHLILPSERLITGTQAVIAVSIAAADKLFPLRHYMDLLQGAGNFTERYFASSLHSLLNISTLIAGQRGSLLFATSDSGEILLCKLMSIRRSPDESIVSFPYDEIGHLYGVSRTHIRRLMKKAESEGLVRLLGAGGRTVEILPALDDVYHNMVASHVAKTVFDIHLANRDYDLLPMDQCA